MQAAARAAAQRARLAEAAAAREAEAQRLRAEEAAAAAAKAQRVAAAKSFFDEQVAAPGRRRPCAATSRGALVQGGTGACVHSFCPC